MKRQRNSIDGFTPRAGGTPIGSASNPIGAARAKSTSKRALKTAAGNATQPAARQANGGKPAKQSDIDESLKAIDGIDEQQDGKKRKKQLTPEQHARRKKRIKRIIFAILAVLILIIGYVGIKALIAGGKVFDGDLFGFIQKAPLKEDANGRSNIVIFGTAEDDEGGEHGGANLTDSLMVVSIDQNNKDAYMISLPRDLWVKYEDGCDVGYEGKINAVYYCASQDGKDEKAGAAALQKKVGEVLGLDVQYYAHLNFTAVIEAVDAVGGVEVTIESEDPRGILDRNFDWKCGYQCHFVNYKNGEKVKLDGEHALALARARNAAGGYGLSNGNFDREKNQQKIIKALQETALSAGTLTNIGKVTGLIDAMGNNLRTNFASKEVRTLADLGTQITGDKIKTLSLVDSKDESKSLVTTGNYMGQSIVQPILGLYDYSGIKDFVQSHVRRKDAAAKEAAKIAVYNGSGVAGVATAEADRLDSAGLSVAKIDNAPEQTYTVTEVYQLSDDNPKTKEKLAELYGTEVKQGELPFAAPQDTDFVVIAANSQ